MDPRLGDAELAQLFARLDVSEEWTLGFLAAVITGPDAIAPSVWLPFIVGREEFDDELAAANIATLTKLHGAVAFQLRASPADVCPDADDVRAVTEYCSGYTRGARLHRRWLADEAAYAPVFIMAALAGELEEEKSEEWKRAHRARIPEYVTALHAYWKTLRAPVAAAPKINRNDPCPCGSGKKYKKCCCK